ncbi:MAG: winged helix-turn-helix domain-containing protein [Alteromonadaceae bacterium]|nr:winged helix-turn-helix domain-containing protein [Alteromonadaceae bacterium]
MTPEVNDLPNRFYINDFLVDLETGEVIFDGKIQVIEPKVMTLLKVLASSPNQVISAETLFEIVWPRAIYSPNSVRRNISLLRQAITDDDKQIIKTHPKRGYSLEADVRILEEIANKHIGAKPFKVMLKSRYLVVLSCVLFVFIFLLSFLNQKSAISLSNLQPVTSSNEQERYMRVSPDGRFMAYIQNTNQPHKRKLLIKDLVTDSHWVLTKTSKAYTYLAWDTHKNALIYSFQDKEGISFGRMLLDKQAEVVSEETLFTRYDITWNSLFFVDKHQNLYYLANQNGSEHSRNVSLYRHSLITGKSETLFKPNDIFKPYKIALSPDQKKLALIGFNKQAISEVKLFNLANKKLKSIAQIDHNWHFLTWFENGNSLILSNGSGLKQLEFTGELKALNYKSYNFLVYPQIVKDKLFFIEAKSDQDILIRKLNSFSKPTRIIDSNTVDRDASLSPDEKVIAYISMKNGLPQLFIKEIETGEERLLFVNTEQEFALTKPVWDKTNKRIISSINNKPFIIHLEGNLFSIEWLEVILGVPLAWYTHTDAILFVDKNTHTDELVRLTLKGAQIMPLNAQLQHKMFFLDNNDRLLFFINGQVTAHQSNKILLEAPRKISFVYPSSKGFYYLYEKDSKPRIQFYDYQQGVQYLSSELDVFCEQYCEQITAIFGNVILLNEKRNSADILKLQVSSI